jgi:hypothetical protein
MGCRSRFCGADRVDTQRKGVGRVAVVHTVAPIASILRKGVGRVTVAPIASILRKGVGRVI